MQTQLERAIRDKKTAEHEVEMITKSAERDIGSQSIVTELTQRLHAAVSEKDEMESMYEA